MAMSLHVLALNGRRQVVKVTPNTTIQKVLEEVCDKQKCMESEFYLMHQNKCLDLGFTVRFSNLSNNAKLELVKRPENSAKDTSNNKITICFSLHSGQRVTKNYNADQNLWEAIDCFRDEKSELGSTIPICVYMRQEIIGEESLRKTSFKTLGIFEGNALIRFFYRSSDHPMIQPHFESIVLPKFNKEPIQNYDSSLEHEETLKDGTQQLVNPAHFEEEMEVDPVDYSINSERLITDKMEKKPYEVINVNQNIEHNINVETQVLKPEEEKLIFIDDQKTILFNLNDVNTKFEETMPEEFFEITIADVRYLLADQKRQLKEMEEFPLQTKALRESEQFTRLKKYDKSIIRINFPDRLVLQGIFKTYNTVKDLEDFVRKFLADQQIDFHFYITPPKRILRSEETLYEVPLVPTAIIHFGSSEMKDHYLKDDLMNKISTFSGAARSTNPFRGSLIEPLQNLKSDDSNKPKPSNKRSIEERDTYESKGAIPKWFNTENKN